MAVCLLSPTSGLSIAQQCFLVQILAQQILAQQILLPHWHVLATTPEAVSNGPCVYDCCCLPSSIPQSCPHHSSCHTRCWMPRSTALYA